MIVNLVRALILTASVTALAACDRAAPADVAASEAGSAAEAEPTPEAARAAPDASAGWTPASDEEVHAAYRCHMILSAAAAHRAAGTDSPLGQLRADMPMGAVAAWHERAQAGAAALGWTEDRIRQARGDAVGSIDADAVQAGRACIAQLPF